MTKEQRKSKKHGEQQLAETARKIIAVTRPVGEGEDTAELIRSLGWTPFILHTVQLTPFDENRIKSEIQSCLMSPADWIVFMSSTGVKLWFDNLISQTARQQFQNRTSFLAVGPRTRETLVSYGVTRTFVPERYSSAGVDEFFSRINDKNLRIVLVRSSSADDSLANSLASRGAIVITVNVYESSLPKDRETAFSFLEGLAGDRFSAVVFTSAVSVSNLFKIAKKRLDESSVVDLLKHLRVGAIGPATAVELRRRGIEPVVPEEFLIEAALKKLVDH